MRVGPKTKRFLSQLKKSGLQVQKGYGKTVAFTNKYAPRAERAFSKTAGMAVESFKPTKFDVEPDFSQVEMRTPRRPMQRMKRHNFGTLTFDM